MAQQSENNGNFPGFMGIFNNVMQNLSKEKEKSKKEKNNQKRKKEKNVQHVLQVKNMHLMTST